MRIALAIRLETERHTFSWAWPHSQFELMLSIITEVQAAYRFNDTDARINKRIVEGWQALLPAMEAKEIYDNHYPQLMKDKGITL
jgi:hypothetical protein